MLKFLIVFILLFINACDNNDVLINGNNETWLFVANEGNYGASTGSISMINQFGDIYETEYLGDVVQSLEVYQDKLIVLINNSHQIKIYDIDSENGINMPGIEINTAGSSPRDLVVVNDKVYFTNWNTQDIKVLNLITYSIENSISIDGLPEDIIYDGNFLWVTVPHSDLSFSSGSKIMKIDIHSNSVVDELDVGYGPQELIIHNNEIFVSRTFYDANWNALHGTAKVSDGNILQKNYGAGVACGGSVLSFNNSVYRSAAGGIVRLKDDLEFDNSDKIGSFEQSLIYHVEVINDRIWFALTNYTDINEVVVFDFSGLEIATYQTGIAPGDFAYWEK